jgi:hypothetical protein
VRYAFVLLLAACTTNRRPASDPSCSEAGTRILAAASFDLRNFAFGDGYAVRSGWLQFWPNDRPRARQGFKLHISYRSSDEIPTIFAAVSRYLVEQSLPHKVVSRTQDVVELTGTQRGKAITLWTTTPDQVQRVVRDLDSILSRLPIDRVNSIRIEGERELVPGIFVRYGQIHTEDLLEGWLYRTDPTGSRVVGLDAQPVIWRGRELSLEDPVRNLSLDDLAERRKVLENAGALVEDQRGTYKPDWISDPFPSSGK